MSNQSGIFHFIFGIRYIANSPDAKTTLKYKWKARTLADAKSIIRLQTNVKGQVLKKGDVVYKEGDRGNSMYFVDEKLGGEITKIRFIYWAN